MAEPDEQGEGHEVPVDLVELFEILEWDKAVNADGEGD